MKKYSCKPRLATGQPIFMGGHVQNGTTNHILIGRLAESGAITEVHLNVNRPLVIAIVGKRGSGKSYTLGSIAESLCTTKQSTSIGNIKCDQAQLLFDTLGIFQWVGIPLSQDNASETVVIQSQALKGWKVNNEELSTSVWIPTGTRDNWTPNSHRDFSIPESLLSAEDLGYLLNLDVATDPMGQLVADVFIKVTEEHWSKGAGDHETAASLIQKMVECANSDEDIINLYRGETRRAITQRLLSVKRQAIFDRPGIPLDELLKAGQLSVVVLNKLADSIRLANLTSLIRAIMRSRIESSEFDKQRSISPTVNGQIIPSYDEWIPPCWVEIDEAQNILPSEHKTAATDSLVRLVREGRNYGISFVITTQQPSSIDQRIMAQVDIMIVHKLSVQFDIDYVCKNIRSRLPEEVTYGGVKLSVDDVIRSLDVGQALVSDSESDRAILMDVRPRISVHGGYAQ